MSGTGTGAGLRLDVYHHADPTPMAPDPRLDRALTLLNLILTTLERQIMPTIVDIQAAIAAQTTVGQGVVALLHQLHASFSEANASEDPAAVQNALDALKANTKALSDAVLANTPSAIESATTITPVPVPVVTPAPEPAPVVVPAGDAPVVLTPGEPNAPPHGEPLPAA
jgi:hypothetical protein